MIYTSHNNNDFFDARLLSADNISLTPEQVTWATELSQLAISEEQQWQTYLNALALLGMEQWLEKRSPELLRRSEWLSSQDLAREGLVNPSAFRRFQSRDQNTSIELISRLEIGDFQLYLVAAESLDEDVVHIPEAIVSTPDRATDFTPDFYVLIEVMEELAQVRVYGYLTQIDFIHHCQSTPLTQEDNIYLLPLHWFTHNPATLLLALTCLEPTPDYLPNRVPLPLSPSLSSPLSPSPISQGINTALWLRGQLDRVAEELAWILIPPTPSFEMRSRRQISEQPDQLEQVITELIRQRQIELPPQIGHAYQEIQLADVVLRLYAVIWELPGANASSDWMLLLILGTPPDRQLSNGTTLQVRDASQLLINAEHTETSPDTFLFAQVRGSQDEQFSVTVALSTGEQQTLSFSFAPEASL